MATAVVIPIMVAIAGMTTTGATMTAIAGMTAIDATTMAIAGMTTTGATTTEIVGMMTIVIKVNVTETVMVEAGTPHPTELTHLPQKKVRKRKMQAVAVVVQ
jgi:hypothetical protein